MGRGGIQVVVALAAACAVAAPAAAMPVGGVSHARSHHAARARHLTRARMLEFAWPAEGTVPTPFTAYHHGLDIGMLRTLDVRAAPAGNVVSVGHSKGFYGYA